MDYILAVRSSPKHLEFVLQAGGSPRAALWGALAFFCCLGSGFLPRACFNKRKTASPVPASNRDEPPCLAWSHEIRNYSSVIKGNALFVAFPAWTVRISWDRSDAWRRTTDKIVVLAQEILDSVSPTQLANRNPFVCEPFSSIASRSISMKHAAPSGSTSHGLHSGCSRRPEKLDEFPESVPECT